jgi:hypothetical protein
MRGEVMPGYEIDEAWDDAAAAPDLRERLGKLEVEFASEKELSARTFKGYQEALARALKYEAALRELAELNEAGGDMLMHARAIARAALDKQEGK